MNDDKSSPGLSARFPSRKIHSDSRPHGLASCSPVRNSASAVVPENLVFPRFSPQKNQQLQTAFDRNEHLTVVGSEVLCEIFRKKSNKWNAGSRRFFTAENPFNNKPESPEAGKVPTFFRGEKLLSSSGRVPDKWTKNT